MIDCGTQEIEGPKQLLSQTSPNTYQRWQFFLFHPNPSVLSKFSPFLFAIMICPSLYLIRSPKLIKNYNKS